MLPDPVHPFLKLNSIVEIRTTNVRTRTTNVRTRTVIVLGSKTGSRPSSSYDPPRCLGLPQQKYNVSTTLGPHPVGASRWVSLSSTAEPDSTPAVALAFPASTLFFQSHCTRRIGSQSRHDILTPAPSMTSESITPKRYARPALLFLLAAIAFFVSACQEGEAPASSESDSDSAAPEAEDEELLVEIEFDEYVVYIDAVVPSGPVTLRLVNQGFEEHNLLFVAVESDSTVWETERHVGLVRTNMHGARFAARPRI